MVGLPICIIFVFHVVWAIDPEFLKTSTESADMCLEVIKSSGQVFKCATTDPKTGVKNDAGKRTQSQQEMVTYDFLMKPTRTKLWIDEKRVKRFKRSMKKEEEVLSRFMEAYSLSNGTHELEPNRRWRIAERNQESSGEDEFWGYLDTIKVHNQKKTTDLYGFLIKPTRTHRTANEEGNRQRRSIGTTGEETLKVDIGPKDSVSTLHRSKRT